MDESTDRADGKLLSTQKIMQTSKKILFYCCFNIVFVSIDQHKNHTGVKLNDGIRVSQQCSLPTERVPWGNVQMIAVVVTSLALTTLPDYKHAESLCLRLLEVEAVQSGRRAAGSCEVSCCVQSDNCCAISKCVELDCCSSTITHW